MRRSEQAQGLRLMKFEEAYGRPQGRLLSQAEAAEVLGVPERTFRRWRDRYEAGGAEGLYDRRLGRTSARRAPVDEVARVLSLFDTRYWDFTARHFHEKLVSEHGCWRSYNWVRLTLQAHGRKRPRRALPGMMLHQDGSSHEWAPGCWWDMIVTMDDATSEIYSAFFVEEEARCRASEGCPRRSAPDVPLHAHLVLAARLRRRLLPQTDAPAAQARHVKLLQLTPRCHPAVHRGAKKNRGKALRPARRPR